MNKSFPIVKANDFKLTAELQVFFDTVATDALYAVRQDDYLQTELTWYF